MSWPQQTTEVGEGAPFEGLVLCTGFGKGALAGANEGGFVSAVGYSSMSGSKGSERVTSVGSMSAAGSFGARSCVFLGSDSGMGSTGMEGCVSVGQGSDGGCDAAKGSVSVGKNASQGPGSFESVAVGAESTSNGRRVVVLGAGSRCPANSMGSVVVGCSLEGVPVVNSVFLGCGSATVSGTASGTVCIGALPPVLEADTLYATTGGVEVIRAGPNSQSLFDGTLRCSSEGVAIRKRLLLDMRISVNSRKATDALGYVSSLSPVGNPTEGYGLEGMEKGDLVSIVSALACVVKDLSDRLYLVESSV